MASLVPVQLSLQIDLQPLESVCIVGDTNALSNWNAEKAPLLERKQGNIYTSPTILAEPDSLIMYRYFTCITMEHPETKIIIRDISRWESNRKPRKFMVPSQADEPITPQIDVFGMIEDRLLISEGWLRETCEIRLRIHGNVIRMDRSKMKDLKFRVYFYAIDTRQREPTGIEDDNPEMEEEWSRGDEKSVPCHSNIFVANFLSSGNSDCKVECGFKLQDVNGTPYDPEVDYLVMKMRTASLDNLVIRADLYEQKDLKKVASGCFPMFMDAKADFGMLAMPLFDKKQRHVGQMKVDYVLMQPLKTRSNDKELIKLTWSRHWKKRLTLDIAHRGMGNSYSKFALVRENTIRSLKEAGLNGADFVEFDVQLSKDMVPVIFHDFHIKTLVKSRGSSHVDLPRNMQATHSHEAIVTPLNALKLTQLRMLSLCHVKVDETERNITRCATNFLRDGDCDDTAPFPALQQALRQVDRHVGFNIEIKYPQILQNGESELGSHSFYLNRNDYLDRILKDVLDYGGDRRIVFSTFDPECCVMIQLKQNKYPVLFLTQGKTSRYSPFLDSRANGSQIAVSFAITNQILGVSFHTEELLSDPSPLERAKQNGLVSFIWGDDLDDIYNYRRFKDLGADGVICDRIEGKVGKKTNVFLLESQTREGSSSSSTTPSPNRSPSPMTTPTQFNKEGAKSSIYITPPNTTATN